MPTKNERISLVDDTDDVTAVQAPTPGLILESKMLPLDEPFPIGEPRDDDALTPSPVGSIPSPMAAATVRKLTPARVIAATVMDPAAPRDAPVAIVDLVPFSPTSGPFLSPTRDAWIVPPAPSRGGRVGLSVALAALLGAAGLLVAWRQWWSVRAGHIEISTMPADAIITVGGSALGQHSPLMLDEAPGTYTISVTRDGYARSDRTIDLHAGQEIVLSIALAAGNGPAGGRTVDGAAMEPPSTNRAAAGGVAARRASTGGAWVAAHAPTARPVSKPESAASPTHRAEAGLALAGPIPAPAAASARTEPAPVAAPAPPTLPTMAATIDETPTAREVGPTAGAGPTPPVRRIGAAADTSLARTVAGRVAKALLAIDPNLDQYRVKLPPSLARADMKLSAVVKICVSTDGSVSDVKLLKSVDPAIDAQIPAVLARWRYRPLIADGRPVPFCYVSQYQIAAP